MRGLRVAMGVSIFVLGSCAPVRSEPFVCDPDRAGEIAFGYHYGGAFFAYAGTEANGSDFLFIDGACRFWAPGAVPAQAVTGVLSGELLAEIDAELLGADWASIDGEHLVGCCDGATVALARDEVRASAYQGGVTPSPTFAALHQAAARWAERLGELGEPLSGDAPVRLETSALLEPDPAATAWPLDVTLSSMVDPSGLVVDVSVWHGAEAEALRAASPTGMVMTFTNGESTVRARLVDVLPLADETGCLRPYFPSACRIQYIASP